MLINDAQITGSLTVNATSSFQNIIVSGNILPDTTNVRNLGSVDKYFKEIYVSTGSINFVDSGSIQSTISSAPGGGIQIGSVVITTSSIAFVDSTGSVTQNIAQSSSVGPISDYATSASFNAYTASTNQALSSLQTTSASVNISVSAINTFTSSTSARVSSIETVSASNLSRLGSIETFTSSTSARLNSIETVSASNLNRLSSLENKTGSLATTGSNTFYGNQTISGTVYIANDLIVQGSSSIQYITGSSVSIGTNIVQLNTANPSVRYAGLTMVDSGSVGGSGSFLYDSSEDEFIFVHRGNGVNVTSSHFVLGPETYDSLGNETYLTCNRISKGTGKEHLVDSSIFDNGTTVCVNSNIIGSGTITGTSIIGNICARNGVVSGSSQIDGTSITNKSITIAGTSTSLGGTITLATITGGSGIVSGSSQITAGSTTNFATDVKTQLNSNTVISGSGQVAIASTSGFGTYINQALLTTSSPTFNTVTATLSGNASSATTATTATTANAVAWTGVLAGTRTNYTLKFQPPSEDFAGFEFTGTNGSGAGYFLIRGTSDTGVYTAEGITLVADQGWATIAQRTRSDRGVRIMTGASPSTRICVLSSGETLFNCQICVNRGTSQSSTFTGHVRLDYDTGNSYGFVSSIQNLHLSTNVYYDGTWRTWNSSIPYGATIQTASGATLGDFYPLYITRWTSGTSCGAAQSGTTMFTVNGNGTGTFLGDVIAYGSPSDCRFKENITPVTCALNKVLCLKGVEFDWKENSKYYTYNCLKHDIGFIAQDVQKVIPTLVRSNDEDGNLSLRDRGIIPYLVEAIKEQQHQIEELKSKIDALTK